MNSKLCKALRRLAEKQSPAGEPRVRYELTHGAQRPTAANAYPHGTIEVRSCLRSRYLRLKKHARAARLGG